MSKKSHYIIPIFVPHVGCPNDCVFCNQRKITGVSTDITGKDVERKIEEYLETIPREDRVLEVAFFGGSFTGIDIDVQIEFLDIAYGYVKRGVVDEIRLSTRPDYIDRERLDILKARGVATIELGVQSMDGEVLEKSKRNHSVEDVYRAVELIGEYGFKLGLQMMLGLPGDTMEKTLLTAKAIVDLKPDIARIYPTLVIRDTELESLFKSGKYTPLSIEEAVYRSKIALHMMRSSGIKVIRVGLQPSDTISEKSEDMIAGPFHPSFRQLVESQIYYDAIDKKLSDMGSLSGKLVQIVANASDISYIAGQSGINKSKLRDKYALKKIRMDSKVMKKNHFEISVVEDLASRDNIIDGLYKEIVVQYSGV